jgi:type II restriction/modification system DNA methylase subunit YeeA
MNTKNLKAYAPKARSQFIEAIKKRAAQLGIYQDKITDVQFEGGAAIIEGRAFTKKQGEQRKALERKIEEKSLATHKDRYDLFIREMAYTWFNRLAAIRYMELHDYLDHGFRVLSPAKGNPNGADSLPEILGHASDVVDILDPDQKYLDKNHIIELQLAGNKEEELYRELLLGQCHRLYNIMPFMFEAIDDATELLLPDNLTKTDSILKDLVNEIPEEDWSEIEVIGWLYQFYISEHKDAVMGKVVKSEDIPAATQLFTPNWIVKYLVQNSLGRQWLATYPESELKGKMEYYIEPADQSDEVIEQLKVITPTSIDPEQIKVLDPAAGSGHILVEVYEVLREIYLERGYRLREIPELIITKNIYGLDIDDRAAQLAGFALMMKAREDDRRIFQRVENGDVQLNVYSMQSSENSDIDKLWQALNLEGKQQAGSTGGLFDIEAEGFVQPTGIYKDYFELLQTLKSAFLQAKTLGSLIQIDNCYLQNLVALKELLQAKESGSDPSAKQAASDLLPIVNQAIVLAQQYDVVVANPPYMGKRSMSPSLKNWLKSNFSDTWTDLFAVFLERCFLFNKKFGFNAQVNMQSWMFLSSYEKFRASLIKTKTIHTMAHLGARAFGQISGEVVQTTATILINGSLKKFKPKYYRLIDGNEETKRVSLLNKNYEFSNHDMKSLEAIPGSPIAYWISEKLHKAFLSEVNIDKLAPPRIGMMTSDNERFLRSWSEIEYSKIGFNYTNRGDAEESDTKWFPYNKGGGYRKWAGFQELIVNWKFGGKEIIEAGMTSFRGKDFYFKESLTWSDIATGDFSCRHSETGSMFDIKGTSAFPLQDDLGVVAGVLNSKVGSYILNFLNPTMSYQSGDIRRIPIPQPVFELKKQINSLISSLIDISKNDWNFSEISWSYNTNILVANSKLGRIKDTFIIAQEFIDQYVSQTIELESELNHLLIPIYGLENVIDAEINLKDVNLNYNATFHASKDTIPENWLLSLLATDVIKYASGCMMGRYSLDREGLVYAHSANEGFKKLVSEEAYQTFPADDDGIIPLASEEWLFDDDATTRFKEFIKTVWGNEHLSENLEFVAESLCLHALKPVKGESANDTVRRYFSKQFYKDHCKTYKKRPIYWLFSSGKEKAFECLVYLHRYNEGTLSRMRTEYVTPLMGKYEAQHSLLTEQKLEATTTEARRIEKELKSLEKKQAELRTFDEQLKHYAEMRITLDLDDGVKANYGKFGNLLADVKAIHGKAVK